MDGIIIYEATPQGHGQRQEATMRTVKEVGLKLQNKKCEVGVGQLTFLGDTVSADGLKPDQRKLEVVQNMQ